MKGKDLLKLCEQYPEFEFEFAFTEEGCTFPHVRTFNNLELGDIGYSSKVVILDGDEKDK